MNKKIIALADCNSFYASCEQVFRPDLWGKPVVVLSNNDGCIIARSKSAKALGIKMGEPFFKRRAFFQKHQVHVFSANFTLYGSLSNRVMNILHSFTPNLEVYSIDEAFLDFTSLHNLTPYSKHIRRQVFQQVGIPISIGIAHTKTLSKLANHAAKKIPQLKGVCNVVDSPQLLQHIFKRMPVQEVWGIGEKHTKMLNQYGIFSIADFMACSPNWVQKKMTVMGLRAHQELHGQSCMDLESTPSGKQSICTSRSFGKSLSQFSDIEEALSTFVANSAQKLRSQNSKTNSLRVFVHTNPFKPKEKQYQNSINIRLPSPSNSTIELSKHASFALKKIFREGYNYKKVGVILSDFIASNATQQRLVFNPSEPKHNQLMHVLDYVQERWGKESIKLASQGTKKAFKMRQKHKSPQYTTNMNEIVVFKI